MGVVGARGVQREVVDDGRGRGEVSRSSRGRGCDRRGGLRPQHQCRRAEGEDADFAFVSVSTALYFCETELAPVHGAAGGGVPHEQSHVGDFPKHINPLTDKPQVETRLTL